MYYCLNRDGVIRAATEYEVSSFIELLDVIEDRHSNFNDFELIINITPSVLNVIDDNGFNFFDHFVRSRGYAFMEYNYTRLVIEENYMFVDINYS